MNPDDLRASLHRAADSLTIPLDLDAVAASGRRTRALRWAAGLTAGAVLLGGGGVLLSQLPRPGLTAVPVPTQSVVPWGVPTTSELPMTGPTSTDAAPAPSASASASSPDASPSAAPSGAGTAPGTGASPGGPSAPATPVALPGATSKAPAWTAAPQLGHGALWGFTKTGFTASLDAGRTFVTRPLPSGVSSKDVVGSTITSDGLCVLVVGRTGPTYDVYRWGVADSAWSTPATVSWTWHSPLQNVTPTDPGRALVVEGDAHRLAIIAQGAYDESGSWRPEGGGAIAQLLLSEDDGATFVVQSASYGLNSTDYRAAAYQGDVLFTTTADGGGVRRLDIHQQGGDLAEVALPSVQGMRLYAEPVWARAELLLPYVLCDNTGCWLSVLHSSDEASTFADGSSRLGRIGVSRTQAAAGRLPVAYAAADDVWWVMDDSAVYRSTPGLLFGSQPDGGNTWSVKTTTTTSATLPLLPRAASLVATDAEHAAIWIDETSCGTGAACAKATGLWVTSDGGATWTPRK